MRAAYPTAIMKPVSALLLSVLLVASACVIDTMPMPEDRLVTDEGEHRDEDEGFPTDSEDLPPEPFFSGDPVIVVGEEHAVPSGSLVVIENKSRPGESSQAPAASDGSFALRANVVVGETVDYSVLKDGVRIRNQTIVVPPGSVAAFAASQDLLPDTAVAPLIQVSAPDDEGLVRLTPGEVALAPGLMVVVANLTHSAGAAKWVEDAGSFEVHIAGQSGDELTFFAVEGASGNGGGRPITLTVP